MKKTHKNSKIHYFILFLMILAYISTIYFWISDEKIIFIISFSCQAVLSLVLCLVIRLSVDSPEEEYDNISVASAFEKQRYDDKVKEVYTLTQKLAELNRELDEVKKVLSEKDHVIDEQAATIDTLNTDADEVVYDINSLLPMETEADLATPTIDIIEIARKVVEELSESARKNNIQIQISTSSVSLPVKAAPSRLRILFRNIVDNSIKYMNKSGVLVITISNIGTDIFIVLKDNGNGLEATETEHVFELNYQGSNRVSGNGLGLTQSKAIVEFYGGTIYAKSNKDQGMGIYIQLPLS